MGLLARSYLLTAALLVAGTAYATFVIAFQLVDDGGALRREGVLRGTLISVASLALRLLLLEPLKFGLMALCRSASSSAPPTRGSLLSVV